MMRQLGVILLLAVIFPLTQAHAAPVQALSRYGSPKYSGDFKNLDGVNPNAPKGGELRLGAIGTFDTLNKDSIKGIFPQGLLLVYDPLMKRVAGEPFTVYGVIAKEVEVASDNSSITFFLDPDARFHDGSPITAEDVKFTIELLREKGLPRYRKYFSRIESMEIINPTTIKMNLLKGEGDENYDPELPLIISMLRVLPKKQLENSDFPETGLTPIIGSGPYRIGPVEQGKQITFERVPDYWAKDLPINKGQYNFDKIHINYYRNAATYFQSFTAGEFDVFYETDPYKWQTAYDIPAVKNGRIKKVVFEHNLPVTVKMMIFNMRRPLFQDIHVRKALTFAFDFDTLNRISFGGGLKQTESLFANTVLAPQGAPSQEELEILNPYKEKIPAEVFEAAYCAPKTNGDGNQRENLAKAGKLLDEAGWKLRKGQRVNQQGQPLRFTFMLHDPSLEKVALAYKGSLKKLGVDLHIERIDRVQYEAKVVESDFDMIMHAWSNGLSPGNEQAYYFGKEYAAIKGSTNYIGVTDPTIEAIARKVPLATDYAALTTCTRALDRVVNANYFWVPFGYVNVMYFAYWADRIAYPPLDPNVAPNIMESGWSQAVAAPAA